MPFDPGLAARLDELLAGQPGFSPKKMFGGIGWLINGHMCVGIYKDWLIARVGPAADAELLKQPHVKVMDITGRPMKGWVMVAPDGIASDRALKAFITRSVDFVAALPAKEP